MDFTEVIENAQRFAGKRSKSDNYDDLVVDRLHNRYTVAILVCCCIAISTYDCIGDPLKCWVPAQFTGNYEDFTNTLCYIQNTYHIDREQEIPRDSNIRHERTLKYYQWINFVLLFQALLFSLPRIIWRSLNDKIGLSVGNLINASNAYEWFGSNEDRDQTIRYICDRLEQYEEYTNPVSIKKLNGFRKFRHKLHLFCQARTGASLTFFYVFIRFLYMLNVVVQIILLQYFLSYHEVSYIRFGYEVFRKFLSDFSLPETKLFPRITLCDFQIRELSINHKYTVECILSINFFIEKLYFILWIWFGILLLITALHTIRILFSVIYSHPRTVFLAEHLSLILRDRITQQRQFEQFRRNFPMDNWFALRLLAANSNPIIVAEILHELYRRKIFRSSHI